MHRFKPLVSLLLLGLLLPAQGAERKPNVIVFLVDDLGWTDLGCFGSDFYETPNIDRLAATGVRFTQGYSACTVCSPSRAALLTGQYPARLHVTDFIPGHPIENTPLSIPDWTQHLELKHVTIAELLKDHGYHTAHLGKWHLTPRERTSDGNFPDYYPEKHGFDVNIGGCESGAPGSYFWPYGRGQTLEQRKKNNIFRTLPAGGEEGEYLTDRLAEEAVKLIRGYGDEPFFMYFSFYNVHTPLQGRPDLVEKYERKLKANPSVLHDNPVYAAMVESVDEAVSRVLTQLIEQGVEDETFIIFTSDNGGLKPEATDNLPIRQGKGSIYEGGTRVPWIVRLPGVTPEGKVSEEPVVTVDILPTIADVTGAQVPAKLEAVVDGLSLLSVLRDRSNSLSREGIFWHYPHYHMGGARPYSAVRVDQWKLIEVLETGNLELYDLSRDMHENSNLSGSQPERARQMHQRLIDWRERVEAQLPEQNPDYNPGSPTGWMRGDQVREQAPMRD